jgi:hypothetical protein
MDHLRLGDGILESLLTYVLITCLLVALMYESFLK